MPAKTISIFFTQLLFGALLLIVFHLEPLNVGPFKVSHIWKGLLLGALFFWIIRDLKFNAFVYRPLLLLCIVQLLSPELVFNPVNAVTVFFTTLLIPIFGIFTLNWNFLKGQRNLVFLSTFFVLCFVPYQFGLLESLNTSYDFYSSYGFEDVSGLTGPFQTVHSASTALAGSLIVLTFFCFSGRYNRAWLVGLIAIGLYFLFATYARTGMAMYVLGLIPILFYYARKSARTVVWAVAFTAGVALLVGNLIYTNDALMARIMGDRVSSNEFESFERLGSGRGLLYVTSVEIFSEMSVVEKVIGIGETEQKSRMGRKIGAELVPHNGFLYLVLTQGVLGLLLFLWFIGRVYKFIRSMKGNEYRALSMSMFLAYLTMTFFQNYDMIYMFALLSMCLSVGKNAIHDSRLSTLQPRSLSDGGSPAVA